MLTKNKITSLALHGGKSQSARTVALGDFKSGKLRVLVATDIAARGLDIEDLPHVVNYEIPNVPEDYVHRIGRTGRAGKDGFAVSLVSLDEEGFLNNILKFAGKADIPRKNDMPTEYGPALGEKAEPIAMGQMTLWGGAGPIPSRAVMDAAGKAKRKEIAASIRERKDKERDARAEKDARKQQNVANHNSNGGGGNAKRGRTPQDDAPRGGGDRNFAGRGGRGGSGAGNNSFNNNTNNAPRGGRGGFSNDRNNGNSFGNNNNTNNNDRSNNNAPRGGRGGFNNDRNNSNSFGNNNNNERSYNDRDNTRREDDRSATRGGRGAGSGRGTTRGGRGW